MYTALHYIISFLFYRFDDGEDRGDNTGPNGEEKLDTKLQPVHGDIQTRYEIDGSQSDENITVQKYDNVSSQCITVPQTNCQNQLCVENPAEFRNDRLKEPKHGKNSINDKPTPPPVPTRGVLTRVNKNIEDEEVQDQ